jgi:hypothetical protein
MIDLSYDFIITLQKEVSRQFGVDAVTPSDCKRLSVAISASTAKLLSETTLKRFFGFATAEHSFSRYTLNTLAQYCSYKDWEDFQTRHYIETGEPVVTDNKWGELKSKAVNISHYTITTIKNRAGIPFATTMPRTHCFAHMERFLEGNYAATAFIAPSGWGKSTTLVHLAEHYWFSKDAKYKQDICWFVNAHAVGNLLLRGFALNTWLDHQMNLGNGENFREYFASQFENAGGRMILIIDGFDDIVMSADKLKLLYAKLEEFVYSNDRFPWIKVILSIRSTSWADMFQHSRQAPSFRRYWYLGNEMDEETNTNMPQLTEQEVKAVLYSHQLDPATVRTFSDPFVQVLRYPYYLQLFCQLNEDPDQPFMNEQLALFEMVARLIQTRVFSSPANSFKMRIIDKLLQLINLGRSGQQHTDKTLLLDDHGELLPAYKELLTDNILIEDVHQQEIAFRVNVRFTHPLLLEYFTAMNFVQDNPPAEIAQELVKQLGPSRHRMGVLRWVLRYAINNELQELLNKLFNLPLSNGERAAMLECLTVHFQYDQRYANRTLKDVFPIGYFRKNPLHRFLSDNFLHLGKRRLLQTLLELADAPADRLQVHSLQFAMSLLRLDAEQCEQELNIIKKVGLRELPEEEIWVTPYELYLFIFEYLKFGIVNEGTKERIYNYHRFLHGASRQPLSASHEWVFRMTGLAFVLMKDTKQLSAYVTRVFECYPLLMRQKAEPLRLSLLCWQAFACMEQGELPAAMRIVKHLDTVIRQYSFDFTGNRFLEVMQRLLQAYIYFSENELNKAMRTAEAVIDTAHKLDFKLIMMICYQLLDKIYPVLKFDKHQQQMRNHADLIIRSTSFKQINKFWGK